MLQMTRHDSRGGSSSGFFLFEITVIAYFEIAHFLCCASRYYKWHVMSGFSLFNIITIFYLKLKKFFTNGMP
jgi:hypothetical protein